MKFLHSSPSRAAWLGALGGLVITLAMALAMPNQALAQETPTFDWTGLGSDTVEFDENSLGSIGDYQATDPGGSAVTYELSGADADDFYVSNLDDDAGTVYNNRAFDFEDSADKQLTFTVTATAGGSTISRAVTVTVGDTNDRPAFMAGVFECGMTENDVDGADCLGWPAADIAADDDDTSLTYSLSDASPLARYLDIDPATGAVTLSIEGVGNLDFESRPEFKVSIRVSDGKDADGNPDAEIDDRAVVRVVVQDSTYESPALSSQLVLDKHSEMRVVWTTDMDTAQQYQIRYRAVGESAWQTHDLTADGALEQGYDNIFTEISGLYADTEYELQYCRPAYCATGTWFGGDNSPMRTKARPNTSAVITGVSSSLSVAENADPAGIDAEGNPESLVGMVYVNEGADDDADQNEMRFWLEGDGAANFAVSALDAHILTVRATKALDHETKAAYTLTLHVSDGRSATGAKDLSSDDSRQLTITVTDVLERPDSPLLAADEQGPNSVGLTWDTPDAGDQTIAGYYVQYRQAGETKWGHTSRITGNTVTIGHLDPNTAYEFRGITVTTAAPATWSDRELAATLTVTTDPGTAGQRSEPRSNQSDSEPATAPASPPPAPQNLSAAAGDGTVTLSWDAPDDPSVTGYQILRKLLGTRDLQVYVADTGSAAASFTDTEVKPGTRYVYRVKAINAAGISDWSNYVRITPG